MKNIIFAATAMIVAMTAVSCSKVAGIEENPSYTYRFAVVNEELPSVKSDMSSDHLVFETGDYLGFSLEKEGKIAYTERTSIQTTKPRPIFGFTTNLEMKAGDRIYVVSPRVLPIDNGKFNDRREPVNADPMQSITIPLVQTHKGGKFDGAAMPMVSVPFTFTKDMLVGEDNQLQEVKFLNLGALLDFRVFSTDGKYQNEIVRDVIFEADKNIVGEFKINMQNVNPDDEKTLAIDLTSARAEGYLAAPLTNVARTESDAVVGADQDHSGSVRMVVAPGTYTGKVKVRTDKAYYVFNLSPARTFDRNGIYPLGLNLAKATRVVMETVDRANWLVKFVNSYYSDMSMRPEKMYDGDLSSEWVNPWNKPLVGAEEDDLIMSGAIMTGMFLSARTGIATSLILFLCLISRKILKSGVSASDSLLMTGLTTMISVTVSFMSELYGISRALMETRNLIGRAEELLRTTTQLTKAMTGSLS